MGEDRLQFQRFELKYIIAPSLALAVRDFVRSHLEVDEHGAGRPDFAYPIHSLYLDSADLRLYHQNFNGDKNRSKLRLRYYQDESSAPVYFEIKRRVNNAILKSRGAVRRDAVAALLAGDGPASGHLLAHAPRQLVAVQQFCQQMLELRAVPIVHIAYQREAWISPRDNSVRVTLDRQVGCEPKFSAEFRMVLQTPVFAFGEKVILELKFTGRFPDWFGEMARVFNLVQCSASKYAASLETLGLERVRRANFAGQEAA